MCNPNKLLNILIGEDQTKTMALRLAMIKRREFIHLSKIYILATYKSK